MASRGLFGGPRRTHAVGRRFLLALAVAGALAGCAGENPRDDVGERPLLAGRLAGRGVDAYLVFRDGSGDRRLVADAGEPAWSPERDELAFTRSARPPSPRLDVYVASGSGRLVRLLARNAAAPAWSPDGERIAFMRDSCFPRDCPSLANPYEVFTAARDGTRLRRLTRNGGYDGEPDWSPDGERLVFATDTGLVVANADGTARRRLTRGGYHMNPVWSPDGETILYDTFNDVFAVHVETGRVRRLTRNPGPDRGPAWSPDGTRIAYLSKRACAQCFSAHDPLELWTMQADGSDARRLRPRKGYTSVDWT